MKKIVLAPVIAALLLFATMSVAEDQDTAALASQLKGCAEMIDTAKRLSCYDKLTASLQPNRTDGLQTDAIAKPAHPLTPGESADMTATQAAAARIEAGDSKPAPAQVQPVVALVVPEPPPPKKKPLFGKKERPSDVESTLLKSEKDSFGRLVFYFDNGQIWRQTEKGYFPIPRGYRVSAVVSAGVLGSYNLRLGGDRKKTKVTRIK